MSKDIFVKFGGGFKKYMKPQVTRALEASLHSSVLLSPFFRPDPIIIHMNIRFQSSRFGVDVAFWQ